MEKASSEELMSLEEWEFLDFGHDAHVETQQDDDAGVGGGDEPCSKEFVKDIPVVVLPPDQDPVSQVFFFKKMKDAEFVDMKKMGSPRASAKLILPHAEPDPDPILFDDPKEVAAEDKASKKNSSELREEEDNNNNKNNNKNMLCSEEDKGSRLLEGIGFTVWRWRVNGIGALCSIGVAAAATICVFVLGGKQRQKQQHQHQHQKIQFQIYAEDKRIKQVVQQATRLNQAISAMRGAPITRAHISFGGYYDGL